MPQRNEYKTALFPSVVLTLCSSSSFPLQLVAGSVVVAFEEVCPDRIDLIHKNYRKLCNLLVDVEEWGQVVIISMLTRYARTQFTSPWKEVSPPVTMATKTKTDTDP